MAYVVADRVKETSTSTGTGNFTLAGAATGFRTFSSGIGNGNTTTYVITDATGSQWEIGLGTLSGGTTLARTSIFINSSGGTTALNFSAGTKNVFVSMSAAPRNSNTSLGTALGFSPDSLQFTTVIGYGASVSADYATAVGQYATAAGGNGVAVGGAAYASSSATAVGQQANASASGSSAYGVNAGANGSDSIAIGNSAQSAGAGGVVVGSSSSAAALSAPYDNTVIVGSTSSTAGGITIGSNSPGNAKNGATIIGHGVTPLQDDATYMNKFRTSVTPVGTQWFLKWDDSTKEVYADPGPTPPAGANWYAYETLSSSGSPNVAMPSGMPTSSFGGGNTLWSVAATTGSASPSGTWSYNGTTGFYNGGVYSATSPQSDPTTYSGTVTGTTTVYYAGYETDAGTSSTYQVYTGTLTYSNTSSGIYTSSFSVFGGTQYGHSIVVLSGNYVGSITPASGVTLVEEFYDSNSNYTYAFFDLDSSGVSTAGSGLNFATISGTASYEVTLWYNY